MRAVSSTASGSSLGAVVFGMHAKPQLAERMLQPLHAHQDGGRRQREGDRLGIVADPDRDPDASEQPDHRRITAGEVMPYQT